MLFLYPGWLAGTVWCRVQVVGVETGVVTGIQLRFNKPYGCQITLTYCLATSHHHLDYSYITLS